MIFNINLRKLSSQNGEVSVMKTKGFQASTISRYDFSTLYTMLPHNLIRNQLLDLDVNKFFIWLAMKNMLFSLPKNIKNMIYGLVKK